MAAATDELTLLERVFLRLGSADTDEQLQAAVCKFLPPVLLKLSSSQEGVRKKVMELLVHINKRIKSRPQVQLPVEALLLQYQDPSASSFVINFTIIYIKLGYPRMEMSKQAELVPSILNAIEGKPTSHQDSLLLIIMPALGHIKIPTDPEKRASLLGLHDKPVVTKQLLHFMLDVLLLPYGTIQAENQQSGQPIDWSQYAVPPGLSTYAFKRVIGDNPPTADQLERTKLGIVKFITGGLFPDADILVHLIVAVADTRFSVTTLADVELKKIVGTLDWSSAQLAAPLYTLFLGTEIPMFGIPKVDAPEMRRLCASTRIRLKLLHYLCRVTKTGFMITPCIQIVFTSLYGKNTNAKLKSLALQFTSNIVQHCPLIPVSRVAPVILDGMLKLINEGEDALKPMAYTVIGQLGQRIPSLINKDLNLLHNLFDTLVSTDGELRRTVRDALISITSAFTLSKKDESNITLMNALLSVHIESPESNVRFVAMHYAATVFPPDDAPSRYLLLLACGDNKHEISTEAKKALYGVPQGGNEDLAQRICNSITLPEFTKLVSYVYSKMQLRMPAAINRNTDKHVLPYSVNIFSEIITYFRVCLARSAKIPGRNEPLQHPCKDTPIIGRYLASLYESQPEILNNYLNMILLLCHASADHISLNALLEVLGSVPHYITKEYEKELPWLDTLLTSTKQDIRQLAGRIYAAITGHFSKNEFEKRISFVMSLTNTKNLEAQHGTLITLTYMMERKLMQQRNAENSEDLYNWTIYQNIVNTICVHLHNNTTLLKDAAIQAIGLLGKTYSLPLPEEGDDKFNKKTIVETLFSVLSNAKLNTKMKEKAAFSLGYLCIGECFPYTADIANRILTTVKETKDIEIHLVLGKALVYCVQGQASSEARDSWMTLSVDHVVPYSKESDELLVHVLDELFKVYQVPHPNLRQAVCVWLFVLLKHNVQRECVKARLSTIHHAFIDFLSDDSDIIQDIASKGLSFVHINSKQEERDALVSNILDQFMQGRRTVQQVTADTKLFEEGQLGKSPSGSNLSTYREICSLATELQKPELVYYFMHLANHNAIWTSKKGAAFGFAKIASIAHEELDKYLPSIIPRLYRYQFDPVPKIQQSMTSIWRAVVPSTMKAIEQYHKEILTDVTDNLTNVEWRVRISCCNALADLLKTNVQFNFVKCGPELWKKLFRVMDDIHEGTRLAATNTTKILSKVCIRHCASSHKNGKELIQAILPVLLNIGITNTVDTVRAISLQTISQLVSTAGVLLKPSLVNLIPALLETIGESENPKLSYLSNVCGATVETQEVIDNMRANFAKVHYASDTITKCIQYIDANVLRGLMPKVIDLIKCSVGFGTKIACSHFIILISTHLKAELQPYSGKILSALLNGLLDRNAAVKKNNAVSIGHIVGSAKNSSLEKLFNTLNTWYLEREDDAIRLAIGQVIQSINNYNQEKWKNYKNIVIPLVFFAMHAEKVPENESTIELWTDIWNEITPGTEAGIVQNLQAITNILRTALESSSWTTKVQAANAIHTIALKSGHNIDNEIKNTLLQILTDGLRGRTWNGKERLLNALAMLACNSKETLIANAELLDTIVTTLHRESKKDNAEYRRNALRAFATILHELDIDKFTEIYEIVQEVLFQVSDKNNDDEENTAEENRKKKENNIKLQEIAYEVLGKAWPSTKETQDKYCIEFVTHCQKILPNSTRSVQVIILTALNLYVDRLVLLKLNKEEISSKDKELLGEICDRLNKILLYCINISKFTRIRKEALNIVLSLTRKLRETNNDEQLDKITHLLKELLPDLAKDNQPEIRTRVVDIKDMLKI